MFIRGIKYGGTFIRGVEQGIILSQVDLLEMQVSVNRNLFMSGRESAVIQIPRKAPYILQGYNSCKLFGAFLHPGLPTDVATKSIYDDTDTTDSALHRAIAGLYLSSICDKTTLLC